MPRHVDPLVVQLRNIRRGRGISQAALAEKIGTNRETLCGWENGTASPSLAWLRRWLIALDLPHALNVLPPEEAPTHV